MLPKPVAPTSLTLVALIALLAVSGGACAERTQTNKDATPVLSRGPSTALPMPPLNAHSEVGWVLSNGTRAQLADYQGKVLVLDFYATWCEPCRKSIPQLIALQHKYDAKDFQVVGLNVGGPDDRIKVSNFARELGIQYPLGFPDQALSDLFLSDDQTIPQTFLFRRDGELQKRFIGYDAAAEAELEKAIGVAVNSKQ
jgi:thiol-disulfide isomerase/thioredoxin